MHEVKEQKQASGTRLASLIFYTISLIVICLTAFNFYLLVWIWSSLRGGGEQRIDLLSSWHELRLRGKLATRGQLVVNEIELAQESDRLDVIAHEARAMSSSSIRFSQGNNSSLLQLTSDRVSFESGLQVRGSTSGRVALVCGLHRNEQTLDSDNVCQVAQDGEQTIELSNRRGVDFRGKSVHTNRVQTRRIHSSLNELHLVVSGHNEGAFSSADGPIRIHSMDDVILASKQANVIMSAKTINLSLVLADKLSGGGAQGTHKGYKLCICLEATPAANRIPPGGSGPTNRAGQLFGIRSGLRCEKFTKRFCQQPKRSSSRLGSPRFIGQARS